MVTKKQFVSERVKPDGDDYLASERALQSVFASHPQGMDLPVPCVVEAHDRASRPALRASPNQSVGKNHVVALADSRSGASK